MKFNLSILQIIFTFISFPLFAINAGLQSQDMTSSIFSRLHQINLIEIKAGELAQVKGDSIDVKRFGSRLVSDHKFMNTQLLAIAKKLDIPILGANAYTIEDRKKIDNQMQEVENLQLFSGSEFDKQFLTLTDLEYENTLQFIGISLALMNTWEARKFLWIIRPILLQHKKISQILASHLG